MNKLFIVSLNEKVAEVRPGLLSVINTIKQTSTGNLFGDLKILTNYVLPKLNTLAAIEQQLSELTTDLEHTKSEKTKLDEELKAKIGQITGLSEEISRQTEEINKVRASIVAKDRELDDLKLNIASITLELNNVKLVRDQLFSERNDLINQINTKIADFHNSEIHAITTINEIPDLLIKVVTHLRKTNESDTRLFELIDMLFNQFFNKVLNINLSKEITSLSEINDALNQINVEVLVKLDNIEQLFNKYSELFSSNLLFEDKLKNLDDLLYNYELLNNFKKDIQNLIS